MLPRNLWELVESRRINATCDKFARVALRYAYRVTARCASLANNAGLLASGSTQTDTRPAIWLPGAAASARLGTPLARVSGPYASAPPLLRCGPAQPPRSQ